MANSVNFGTEDAELVDGDDSGCWPPATPLDAPVKTSTSAPVFNDDADDTLAPHFAAILADDDSRGDDYDAGSSFFASKLPKLTNGGRSEKTDAAHLSIELQHAYKILRDLMSDANRRVSLPFIDPVETIVDDMVDYEEVVKKPLWLKKVKELLLGNKYETITEFVADVRLILENCYRYYGPDHAFSKKALKLEQMLEQKLALLPREIRDKTTLETTSGLPIEESCGVASRRRCTRQTVDYVSVLLNRVRHEKSFRDKELRKKQTEERKQEKEEKVQETVQWEDRVLLGECKVQMKAMWELPLIGHFLYLCQTTLNMPEVSQFELERMLLMPRASSLLPKVMTSLLSNPQMRANLDKKPAMPYRVWNNRLQNRIQSWYKICQAREYRGDLVFQQLGIEAEFFRVLGPENPLNDRMFHELTFHQRVWCLKGLCDYVMQNHKAVQDTMNEQIAEDMREYVLGVDAKGNKYLHFPQFCGQDLRIYRQKISLVPPQPKAWMTVFDKKRPLELPADGGDCKKVKMDQSEKPTDSSESAVADGAESVGLTGDVTNSGDVKKLETVVSDDVKMETSDADDVTKAPADAKIEPMSSDDVEVKAKVPKVETDDVEMDTSTPENVGNVESAVEKTTASTSNNKNCDDNERKDDFDEAMDRLETLVDGGERLLNGPTASTDHEEVASSLKKSSSYSKIGEDEIAVPAKSKEVVEKSGQAEEKFVADDSTVSAVVREVSKRPPSPPADEPRPDTPTSLPPSPVQTRRSARLSVARLQVAEPVRTTRGGRVVGGGDKTSCVSSSAASVSSLSSGSSVVSEESSGSSDEDEKEKSDEEAEPVAEIDPVGDPVAASAPDLGSFELVVDSLETLRNFMIRFDATVATPAPTKSRAKGKGGQRRAPQRSRCEVELHGRLDNLLTELLPWEVKLDKAAQRVRMRLRKEFEDFVERDEIYDDSWDSDKEGEVKRAGADESSSTSGTFGNAAPDSVAAAAGVRTRNRKKAALLAAEPAKVEPKLPEVDTQELLDQMGDSTEYPTRGRIKQLREGVKVKKDTPPPAPPRRKINKPEPSTVPVIFNGGTRYDDDDDYVPPSRGAAVKAKGTAQAQEHFAWETLRQILVPPANKPVASSVVTVVTTTAAATRTPLPNVLRTNPAPTANRTPVVTPLKPTTAISRPIMSTSLFSPSPDKRHLAASSANSILGAMQAATQAARGPQASSSAGSSARTKVDAIWSSSVFSPLRSPPATPRPAVTSAKPVTLAPSRVSINKRLEKDPKFFTFKPTSSVTRFTAAVATTTTTTNVAASKNVSTVVTPSNVLSPKTSEAVMMASIAQQQLQGNVAGGKPRPPPKTMLMSVRGQDGRTTFVRVASSTQAATAGTVSLSKVVSTPTASTTVVSSAPPLQSYNPTVASSARRIPPEATSSVMVVRPPPPAAARPVATPAVRQPALQRLQGPRNIFSVRQTAVTRQPDQPANSTAARAGANKDELVLIRVAGKNGETVYMQVPRSDVVSAAAAAASSAATPVGQPSRTEIKEPPAANPPSPTSYLVQLPTVTASQQTTDVTTTAWPSQPQHQRLIPALTPHRAGSTSCATQTVGSGQPAHVQSVPAMIPTTVAVTAGLSFHQLASPPSAQPGTTLGESFNPSAAFDADSFFAENVPNGLTPHSADSHPTSVLTSSHAVAVQPHAGHVMTMMNGLQCAEPTTSVCLTSVPVQTMVQQQSPAVVQNHYSVVQHQHLQVASTVAPTLVCQPQRVQLVTTSVAPSHNHQQQQQVIHRYVPMASGATTTTTTPAYTQSNSMSAATTTAASTTPPANKSANALLASWMSNPALASAVQKFTSSGHKVAITLQGDKIVLQALPRPAVPTVVARPVVSVATSTIAPPQFQRIQIQQPHVMAAPQSMFQQQPTIFQQQQQHPSQQLVSSQGAVYRHQQQQQPVSIATVSNIQQQQVAVMQPQQPVLVQTQTVTAPTVAADGASTQPRIVVIRDSNSDQQMYGLMLPNGQIVPLQTTNVA